MADGNAASTDKKRILRCECGLTIVVVSERDFVEEAQRHAREAHHMDFTPDEILSLSEANDGSSGSDRGGMQW